MRHRDHAPHSAPKKCSRDSGEGILSLVVEGSGLASVQNDNGHRMLTQEGAQILCGLWIGLALFILEDETALARPAPVGRVLVRALPVSAVAIKMKNVIVAGMRAKVLAQLVKGRRTQNSHLRGQISRLD